MIGMLLNVVHLQVHKKKKKKKIGQRSLTRFHNYSTLLTGIEEEVRTDRTMNSEYINLKLVYAFL